jgi:DNA-binding transcriptional regulator YhcF (GntR family)
MNFKETRPIYLQIADRICDEILAGRFKEEDRVTSVRDYAALVEVNPNTVMRTYDYLQQQEVIFNKRGIGYFVSAGAVKMITRMRKENFLTEEVKNFFQQLYTLDIPMAKIVDMYDKYIEQQNKAKNK